MVDYNQIVENSLNEIYIFDANTLKFIEVNHGARENLGYSIEELKELTPLDIKPAYTLEEFQTLITPLYDGTKEKLIFETYHLRKDNTSYPVEVHLQLSTLDNEKLFVAIILDITERQILQNRSTELGRIFEKSLNEIYVFDANTLKFIEVNRGARENLGYTLDEIRTMTPLDIKPEYTLNEFEELIQPLLDEIQSKLIFETYHLRKDGTKYFVEVHLQLSTLEGKKVFVAIILDITDRKNAQKKLLDLNIKDQRAQLIQNFVRDTSHEFRTPLSILGLKTYLLEKSLEQEENLRHIKGMKTQIKSIEKLVESLQKASVLETTDKISQELIDTHDLFQSLLDENQALYNEKQITVKTNYQDYPAKIYGDYDLLRTAIYNIIKNACDFNIQQGKISITLCEIDTHLHIKIQDTGLGIPDENMPYIFDYLYRGDKARSMTGGYGLGLSIADRIIKLHKGQIEVESNLGQGTEFTIKIPIQVAEPDYSDSSLILS